MADEFHLSVLKQGVEAWDQWRERDFRQDECWSKRKCHILLGLALVSRSRLSRKASRTRPASDIF
jgi:hypothetical protein